MFLQEKTPSRGLCTESGSHLTPRNGDKIQSVSVSAATLGLSDEQESRLQMCLRCQPFHKAQTRFPLHRELRELSAHQQDQNNSNGIMTSSSHSGIGFSRPPRFHPATFPLPDKFAVISCFSRAVLARRNFPPPAIFCNSNGETPPSWRSSPRSPGPVRLLRVLLSHFPLWEKTKTLEGGQTLEEPLAQLTVVR